MQENKENMITAIAVYPGKIAQVVQMENTLSAKQDFVGGWIEAYPIADDACIVCNDEGKLIGMELNRTIRDEKEQVVEVIAGPFLIVGDGGENFISLTEQQLHDYLRQFYYPEIFTPNHGYIEATKYDPDTAEIMEPDKTTVEEMEIDLTKAQKQYDELTSYAKENSDAFGIIDLPFSDTCYREAMSVGANLKEEGIEFDAEEEFYQFCAVYIAEFKHELEDRYDIDFDDMQNQIAPNSFYLHDMGKSSVHEMIEEKANEVLSSYLGNYIAVEDGQLMIKEEYTNEDYELEPYEVRDWEYIQEGLFDEIKAKFEDIVTVYETIKEYKENQVEKMKEYFEPLVEKAREEKAVEMEQERKEAIRVERTERLDKLTDQLSKSNNFSEMKAIAKEIKEIKDAMRKEDREEKGRENRNDRNERE